MLAPTVVAMHSQVPNAHFGAGKSLTIKQSSTKIQIDVTTQGKICV